MSPKRRIGSVRESNFSSLGCSPEFLLSRLGLRIHLSLSIGKATVSNTKLKGSKWKKLRNLRNRFCKNNSLSVKDSKDVPIGDLNKILLNWLKRRSHNDRVDKHYFFNLINNNFEGVDMAKTLCVNGRPSTITGGWKIPNSNNYYSSIGILDYSYPGLGEIANIDDLNRLKRKGYDYVDFGGSDKVLLYFKRKFKPEKIYKTYVFSIVRS